MWQRFKTWCERLGWLQPRSIGDRGEDEAWAFLQAAGYKLLARNWRNPRDRREEIDLVCRDGDVLVFVEVKSRGANALVPGYYTVNARKKAVLRRAATAYLRKMRPPAEVFRLDVVEVATGEGVAPQVRHFENVPLWPKHFRP